MAEMTAEVLNDRFEIVRKIGEGGQGRTFLARDLQSGQDVAVKELILGQVADWKAIELFEREARALQNLDHPAIPRYVDAFNLDDGARLFLVQQFVDGESLRARIDRGELMGEPQARAFLEELLDVLDYLHGFSPPVVHRDIKPSNILVRGDGSFALIDFGAVQALASDEVGGSTIVGTTGYMPPEQLMGRATPASDLYALAATIIHLMSGVHPADLPMERMKLQFRHLVQLSPPLLSVLEGMLEPNVGERTSTVDEVRSTLSAPPRAMAPPTSTATSGVASRLHEAAGMNLFSTVSVDGAKLRIETNTTVNTGSKNAMVAGAAALAVGMIVVGCATGFDGLCCMGFPFLFVGVPFLAFALKKANSGIERLTVSPDSIDIVEVKVDKTGGESVQSQTHIPMHQLNSCYLHVIDEAAFNKAQRETGGMPANMFQTPGIVFVDGDGVRHTFGKYITTRRQAISVGMPDASEIRWLYELVQIHLQELTAVEEDSTDSEPEGVAW